jgi:hypothetical protein
MMLRSGAVLLAAAAIALAVGCRESTPQITAVDIVVSFPTQSVDQLRFALPGLPAPTVRPERAGAPLSSPQNLIVYLPDTRVGEDVMCTVEGLFRGAARGTGIGRARVEQGRAVACAVNLLGGSGGGDGGPDGSPGSAAGVPPADGATTDRPPGDGGGPAPGDTGGPPPGDTAGPPPADTNGPPPADSNGPPPADTNGPPPIDMGGPPPVDMGGPPPPDGPGPPPPVGCADGRREGFIDVADFPTIAGCGMGNDDPLTYVQSRQQAAGLCSPGWHWCTAADVGRLPAQPRPRAAGATTCAWLDVAGARCDQKVQAFGQPSCGGNIVGSGSTAGPDRGLCSNLLGQCGDSWKLQVDFDRWGQISVLDTGVCQNNVALTCASQGVPPALGTDVPCWAACCRNP